MSGKGLLGKITSIFSHKKGNDDFFEALEDALLEADLGVRASTSIMAELRKNTRAYATQDTLLETLRRMLAGLCMEKPLPLAGSADDLLLLLLLGVNGTGKTTTCAKLVHHYKTRHGVNNVVLAAGDTFRAASVEQLQQHANRLGCRMVHKGQGADAASVIYDCIISARARKDQLIIADTAGRMHNRSDLVQELQKMVSIIDKQEIRYHKILILDATTGQNAFQQTEIFNKEIGVDTVMLTKCDSSASGGILLPVAQSLNIPCSALCNGENYEDFMLFNAADFARFLLGKKQSAI